MTFDAFWDLLRWILIPLLGVLAWWINLNRGEFHHRLEQIESKNRESLSKIDARTSQEFGALNRQHAAFQLEVVRSYARTDQLERALDRITDALTKIEQKIETLREPRGGL